MRNVTLEDVIIVGLFIGVLVFGLYAIEYAFTVTLDQ